MYNDTHFNQKYGWMFRDWEKDITKLSGIPVTVKYNNGGIEFSYKGTEFMPIVYIREKVKRVFPVSGWFVDELTTQENECTIVRIVTRLKR